MLALIGGVSGSNQALHNDVSVICECVCVCGWVGGKPMALHAARSRCLAWQPQPELALPVFPS
jgi:hypothetical protein